MTREEAIKAIKAWDFLNNDEKEVIETLIPELAESEAEKVRKTLIRVLNENVGNGIEKYGAKLEDALTWLEKQGEQKLVFAWSEDDKKYLRRAINATRNGYPETNNWLKSLKDRVQLQPKQEWSEEDERMCQYVVDDLKFVKELVNDTNYAVSVGRVEEEINWLKSLKDRYTWKPSDEQMEALDDVISSRDIKYDVLSELWKNLKKLMEG